MERRTFLALLLSFAVVMVWNYFFLPPPGEAPTPGQNGVSAVQVQPKTPSAPGRVTADVNNPRDNSAEGGLNPSQVGLDVAQPEAVATIPERVFDVNTSWSVLSFSNVGGGPSSAVLKDFREQQNNGGLLSWLWDGFQNSFAFEPINPDTVPPLVHLLEGGTSISSIRFAPSAADVGATPPETVLRQSQSEVVFQSQSGPIQMEKTYRVVEADHSIQLSIKLLNVGNQNWTGQPSFSMTEKVTETVGPFDVLNRIVYVDESADFEDAGSIEEEGDTISGEVRWFGIGDNYFLSAALFPEPMRGTVVSRPYGDSLIEISFMPERVISLGPGETSTFNSTLYLGPKDIEALKAFNADLDKAIDFGFLSVFAYPLLYLLRFFYSLIGSYGFAIILLTITIKALMFPLTHKSMGSMQRMKEIQPEIKKLQEKYGDNKEQLNQETMRLMSEKKVNPLGGCIPTLVQLPIWFSLYRVLQNSIELYRTPFFYLDDLSAADPYGITPVLVAVLMFVQQQLTPTTSMDPAQKRIMQMMPLFFSFIMFNLPSGLVVYILINSLLSITHHTVFNRMAAAKVA